MPKSGSSSLRLATRLFAVLPSLALAPSIDAQQVRNLSFLPYENPYGGPVLDDSGAVAFAVSSTNQFGTNPTHTPQIVRWDTATGVGSVITDFAQGVDSVSPSDDGEWLAFVSCSNPTGQNHDKSGELFVMKADGTGPAQLLNHWAGGFYEAKISGSGNRIVFADEADLLGTNPSGVDQIFVINRDGTGLAQMTHATEEFEIEFSVSDDGGRIVFTHDENLSGANPAGLTQVFAMESDGTNLRQLTWTAEAASAGPRISKDGARVFFQSDAQFFGEDSEIAEPYRVSVATGIVERVGGTRCCNSSMDIVNFRYPNRISVDRTGTRAVFPALGDWDQSNPDRGGDIYLVDQLAAKSFQIGKAAPTVVSFTTEPKPLHYDVIRGNVANLAPGGGGTVNLGPVVCLEDDSPDANTAGNGDALQPNTGQVLFYLYRGSQGVLDGPGSWGQGSGAKERVAGSGSCQP